MAVQNARMTVGTIFGMVGTAANAVTSVLDTGVNTVGMLDTYVTDLSKAQQVRSKINNSDLIKRLVEEKAMEQTARQAQIAEFCAKPGYEALFQTNHTELMKLFEQPKVA